MYSVIPILLPQLELKPGLHDHHTSLFIAISCQTSTIGFVLHVTRGKGYMYISTYPLYFLDYMSTYIVC